MTWLAGIRIALRALRVNKLRSSLTMLGIIIGVAAVITMIGVGTGAQARVEEQIKVLGSNLIMLLPGSVTSGGARMGAGSRNTLTEDDSSPSSARSRKCRQLLPSCAAPARWWRATTIGRPCSMGSRPSISRCATG